MKMRVADYIAKTVANYGVKHVFMVTGGGAMHLNDAFGREKRFTYIACHHEQACAMAAESYYRLSNRLAVVNVTTGPGCTNALTGVYGAYVDSLAMLIISGQVKFETHSRSAPHLHLRQLGDQEIDIVPIAEHITKYIVMVTDPKTIRYHLEKALHLATSGRPGPVWLDIPINVQGALVEPDALDGYNIEPQLYLHNIDKECETLASRLRESQRPVILAGSGVRLSGAYQEFLRLVDTWGIPVVTAWNAHDLLWDTHPLYIGRPGTIGDRAGNFALQNADFVLVLGSRLNIRQVSYNWSAWARGAYKVIVDIDDNELKKPTVKPDLPIHADLASFLPQLLGLQIQKNEAWPSWLSWCLSRKKRYPVVLEKYYQTKKNINPYVFVEALFKELKENDIVVTGDGTACVVTFQAAHIKKGQRLYTNSGCASMGYDLPAAIGAYFGALGSQRIICLAGDGSIQMNLQELQTIVHHQLPIKIFILNNQGYHSIRQTQKNFFSDNIVGCGVESGLSFPDFKKLAHAYGVGYQFSDGLKDLSDSIHGALLRDGPQICEIMLDLEQSFEPKLSSRKLDDGTMISPPLEDMSPFLSREEFLENMLIPSI